MRAWICFSLVGAALAAACDSSTAPTKSAQGGASASVSVSASASQTSGAGGSGGATPKRKLVDVPFLEGSPTDNRVDDPGLEMDTGTSWFLADAKTGGSPHVNRVALSSAPAGQAALFVPGAPANASGALLGVLFKLPTTGYEASVWIGNGGAGVEIAALTFDPAGQDDPKQFALAADPSMTLDLDGVHWVLHRGAMPAEVVSGWAYLIVQTSATSDLYLQAPIVRALEPQKPTPPFAAPQRARSEVIAAVRRATTPKGAPPPLPRPRRQLL